MIVFVLKLVANISSVEAYMVILRPVLIGIECSKYSISCALKTIALNRGNVFVMFLALFHILSR
jgi:hypothetical protein